MLTLHEKHDFSTSLSETSEHVSLFLFHDWFPLEFVFKYFFDVVRNKLQTINIYTRVDRKIKN